MTQDNPGHHASPAPTTGTSTCATASPSPRCSAHRPPFRPRDRHAQPAPAGATTLPAGRSPIASASSRRLPAGAAFEPLMTLYLTDSTTARRDPARPREPGVEGVKFYPAGATTNSASWRHRPRWFHPRPRSAHAGLRTPARCCSTARSPIPRSTSSTARPRSSSASGRARGALPGPRSCSSTSPPATRSDFVRGRRPPGAATLTPHHLLRSRNAMFAGGLRPHTTACRW